MNHLEQTIKKFNLAPGKYNVTVTSNNVSFEPAKSAPKKGKK